MIRKPIILKPIGFIAFLVYLAIFLAPNGKLFIIRISQGLHLTPMRFVLLIIGIVTMLYLLQDKLNIVKIIRRFDLFLPLILLLFIKIASLSYSSNYLGGITVIEWFIENILFSAICYIYYVSRVIVPSKVLLFIITGFVCSILVALIQIGNFTFNTNFLSTLIDYINLHTPEANLYKITGLFIGDTNCYATYVAAILLAIFAVWVYSKKHFLATAIAFFVCTIVLYSLESRSSVFIFILVLIYMIIRDKVFLKKQAFLFAIIFLTVLSIMIFFFNTKNVFFEKYSYRYLRLINYIQSVDYAEENTVQSHKNLVLRYFYIIDREPVAVITGVGEGDYLGLGGVGEKGATGAHNAYVLILGENGPIAFLIFIYITWLVLKVSFFVNKNSSIPITKSFLYFNIAYLLSFILYGSQFYEYIFWGIIGMTFAEKTRIVTERQISNKNIIT